MKPSDRKVFFSMQKEDRCIQSIAAIYRMTSFLMSYLSWQEDSPYLSSIAVPLLIASAFFKCVGGESIEAEKWSLDRFEFVSLCGDVTSPFLRRL